MNNYTIADIRNIALVGSGGTGKTTLLEALLKTSGMISQVGTVDRGNTVGDYDQQEKEHHHSFYSAIANLEHQGKHINIIDTPGDASFVGRSVSVFPTVEMVVVVVNAAAGIEGETRRMLKRAKDRNLCRMVVINRVDSENVDLEVLVAELQEEFGTEFLPINLPSEGGGGGC